MKPKSMKHRLLATLHVLYKHSDKDHRLNTKKLNEYLNPLGLECGTHRSLSDTVAIMREFGVDVRFTGLFEKQGYWIEDRPLQDDVLRQLVFAVSTNPFLPAEQATEILQKLKPLVTVYQEPMLENMTETGALIRADQKLFDAYSVVCEAIRLNRRLQYTVTQMRYDKETGELFMEDEWPTLFTPKCVYQTKGRLYMVGYNHVDKYVGAVNMQQITGIKLAFKHERACMEEVRDLLDNVDPQDYIPEERSKLIYKGPAIFRSRGQYLPELQTRFGPACGPIKKDARSRAYYEVEDAEIWPETLLWLANIPGHGIRIKGPEGLREAIKTHFQGTSEKLLDARLKPEKTT